jgi:hypothetical protein
LDCACNIEQHHYRKGILSVNAMKRTREGTRINFLSAYSSVKTEL